MHSAQKHRPFWVPIPCFSITEETRMETLKLAWCVLTIKQRQRERQTDEHKRRRNPQFLLVNLFLMKLMNEHVSCLIEALFVRTLIAQTIFVLELRTRVPQPARFDSLQKCLLASENVASLFWLRRLQSSNSRHGSRNQIFPEKQIFCFRERNNIACFRKSVLNCKWCTQCTNGYGFTQRLNAGKSCLRKRGSLWSLRILSEDTIWWVWFPCTVRVRSFL